MRGESVVGAGDITSSYNIKLVPELVLEFILNSYSNTLFQLEWLWSMSERVPER